MKTIQSACTCVHVWFLVLMISGDAEASQEKITTALSTSCQDPIFIKSPRMWNCGARGPGRERGVRGQKVVSFLIEEDWKERDTSFGFLLWKADLTGSLSLAQGAYADSMTFFSHEPDFTLKLLLARWCPLRTQWTNPTLAKVKSHCVIVLHTKWCGTHVNYRVALTLALSPQLRMKPDRL